MKDIENNEVIIHFQLRCYFYYLMVYLMKTFELLLKLFVHTPLYVLHNNRDLNLITEEYIEMNQRTKHTENNQKL